MKGTTVNRQAGFTLLELMVVVTIGALLIGLAVPAMTAFVRSSRMTQAANDVVGALMLARTEAVKRRLPVTFCTSSDGASCAASDTLSGWIVFVDEDSNQTVDGTDVVLKSAAPYDAAITGTASLDPLAITWLDTGFTDDSATLTLVLCDSRGNAASAGELSAARGITVSPMGRPAVTRDPAEIENLGGCP